MVSYEPQRIGTKTQFSANAIIMPRFSAEEIHAATTLLEVRVEVKLVPSILHGLCNGNDVATLLNGHPQILEHIRCNV